MKAHFDYRALLDTVQDLLGKLHMKSKIYRPGIRLTKIINSLLKDFKVLHHAYIWYVVRQDLLIFCQAYGTGNLFSLVYKTLVKTQVIKTGILLQNQFKPIVEQPKQTTAAITRNNIWSC